MNNFASFFPKEPTYTNGLLNPKQEKSSFRDFFKYNFHSSKAFAHSFPGDIPIIRPPRTTPLSQSIKAQSHIKFAGKTWDAPHLNSFINSNPFVAPGEPLVVFTGNELIGKHEENEGFSDENNEKNAFSDRFHEYNHMVTLGKREIPSAGDFYRKFVGGAKHLDSPELHRAPISERISSPKEKLRDLREIKRKIQEFQQEKSKFLIKNKTFRVLKGGFKSGVLSVDNPENPFTVLYKEEFNENMRKNDRKMASSARHRAEIENLTKTNENIAFFNKNYQENSKKSEKMWDHKKGTPEFVVMTRDSKQRIFGENKGEFPRKIWLRGKEHREINIINFKVE